ncbi:L,D-transpeptidase [Tabrizicola aquatica]|uniref:L,D-transpeptidase n=1 Tax=Tabrizicola aquatica TaxID=909926 RepID=UPI000CD1367C|nr:L,D-transpeptidase [Tabrizicola aquatica]
MTHLNRRHLIITGLAAAMPLPALAHSRRSAEDWVIPEEFLPRPVRFAEPQEPGTLIVDPDYFALYHVLTARRGMQYSVGVGRGDLYESGWFTLGAKKEWPSWTPTKDMIARDPDQYAQYAGGMPGGPNNPLGARALYLFDDVGNDTFLRIHGTPEPWTIGSAVSNGCVRLANEDIVALYEAVEIGVPVLLLPKLQSA